METMLLLKTLHLIGMVCWFAALFYLPRLYVYHAMSEDQISKDRFIIMERKLFFGIMTPAAIITIGCGLALFIKYIEFYKAATWLHIKMTLILGLIAFHIWCGKVWFDFKKEANKHSHVFYRWMNELPVVLLIVIIVLAVYKPV